MDPSGKPPGAGRNIPHRPAAGWSDSPRRRERMTSHPASILVVDDERLIRWSLEQQLQREGYTVHSVESGAEAMQRVQADPPDLILLDVRLPDTDGVELLGRLRA